MAQYPPPSVTLAPLQQQEQSMIRSTPQQNLPPRFSFCPQVALHRRRISPNSCSTSAHLLTKLTLFPISHRHYSAAASLLTPGTLPCTTRMKSTSTTPTRSTSPPLPSYRVTGAHTPGYGECRYVKSPATSMTILSSLTLPVERNHATLGTSYHLQK